MEDRSIYQDSVTINLCNGTEKIILTCSRSILFGRSEYFKALLSFGNNSQEEYFIHLPKFNKKYAIHIAADQINKLHGKYNTDQSKSNLEYLLIASEYMDFFCINLDPKDLYNLRVEPHQFTMLLQLVEKYDYMNDIELIILIHKNMPADYDCSNLDPEFVKRLRNIKFELAARQNDERFLLFLANNSIDKENPNIISRRFDAFPSSTSDVSLRFVDEKI